MRRTQLLYPRRYISRLETSKESHQQQIRQLSANRARIEAEINDLQQLIVTDRDEGVAASQEQLTLQSQLEKIGADVEAIEVSIRSSEDELNTLDLQRVICRVSLPE